MKGVLFVVGVVGVVIGMCWFLVTGTLWLVVTLAYFLALGARKMVIAIARVIVGVVAWVIDKACDLIDAPHFDDKGNVVGGRPS